MNRVVIGICDLIYPRSCSGCGKWDSDLCAQCAGQFGPWRAVHEQLPYLCEVRSDGGADTSPFPVWALADYTGCVARSIVRWKNVRSLGLDRRFQEVVTSQGPPPSIGVLPRSRLLIVPAPSRSARRRQGMFVAGCLAHACAELYGGEVVDALRRSSRRGRHRTGYPGSQSGIGGANANSRGNDGWRGRSLRGGLAARGQKRQLTAITRRGAQLVRGADIVLVDDVVTTGATLAGASRVVNAHGGRVIAAWVLAAAHDPRN